MIRRYAHTDKERVLELLRLNTPEYFSPNEEKDLLHYLNNHSDNYYVMEQKGTLVGCGGFNLSADGETAKISWDFFHPQSRGKGWGTILTKFRIDRIREIRGIKIISVRTSQLAYKFYEKFGLEIREIVKDYWDTGFDLYHLDAAIQAVVVPE